MGWVWFGLVWFGLVWFGLVWFGLDWIGLDWIGLDWIGLDWIGLDWFGLDWFECGAKQGCVVVIAKQQPQRSALWIGPQQPLPQTNPPPTPPTHPPSGMSGRISVSSTSSRCTSTALRAMRSTHSTMRARRAPATCISWLDDIRRCAAEMSMERVTMTQPGGWLVVGGGRMGECTDGWTDGGCVGIVVYFKNVGSKAGLKV